LAALGNVLHAASRGLDHLVMGCDCVSQWVCLKIAETFSPLPGIAYNWNFGFRKFNNLKSL
jgi:hypothetical protein